MNILDQVFFCGASNDRTFFCRQRSQLIQDLPRSATTMRLSAIASIPAGSLPAGTDIEWRWGKKDCGSDNARWTTRLVQPLLPNVATATIAPNPEWIPAGVISAIAPVDLTGFSIRGSIRKQPKANSEVISTMTCTLGDPLKGEILFTPGTAAVTELIKPNVFGLQELSLEDAIAQSWHQKPYFYDIEAIAPNGMIQRLVQGKALFLFSAT